MKLLLFLAIVLTFCCLSACVIGPPYNGYYYDYPYYGPDYDEYHGNPYLYRYYERGEGRGFRHHEEGEENERMEHRGGGFGHGEHHEKGEHH